MFLRLDTIAELHHHTPLARRYLIQAFRRSGEQSSLAGMLTADIVGQMALPLLILAAIGFSLGVLWELLKIAALAFATVVPLVLALIFIDRWRNRRAFARFVRRQELPVRLQQCLDCDYNLQGSTSSTCPECGADVILIRSGTAMLENPGSRHPVPEQSPLNADQSQ